MLILLLDDFAHDRTPCVAAGVLLSDLRLATCVSVQFTLYKTTYVFSRALLVQITMIRSMPSVSGILGKLLAGCCCQHVTASVKLVMAS